LAVPCFEVPKGGQSFFKRTETGKKQEKNGIFPFLLISSFFRISVKEILFGLHEWNIQEL